MPRIMLLSLLLFSACPFTAAAQTCPDQPLVLVETQDPAQRAIICRSASLALDFLASYGLQPKRAIRFKLVEQKIVNGGYDAFGSYDSRSDWIALMSYPAIFRGTSEPQMYGEPFDQVLYTGAIAHEVVHAVMQHNLSEKPISIGPQEYLAHATQLAVLPAERRQKIIAAMDVSPWESGDVISDVYMAIAPGKFAVKSYLHLVSLPDPRPFIETLLNAKWFYVYVP